MENKEPIRWVTINGKHVPIFENNGSDFTVSAGQREFEESIRNSTKEHIGFFDKDGNKLFETSGTEQDITFGDRYEDDEDWEKTVQFNREVEQRVWHGEEVHDVHNHPENTIFSPEDVDAFEALENKSMRVVLPNGTDYSLIREQPRTSNVIIIDEKTGEARREFEPKKIGPAYDEAYSKIYNNEALSEIRKKTEYGSPERQRMIEELDRKVATEMEKWLTKNAEKYGYRFVKD